MKAKTFFKKELKYGDKVSVRFAWKTGGMKARTVTLFFAGLRFPGGGQRVDDSEDVIPVFTVPTRRGEMSRRHYGWKENEVPTWLDHIVSIRKTA